MPVVTVLVAGALMLTATPAAPAVAATTKPHPVPKPYTPPPPKAFLLADIDSGAILAAGNEHAALLPASTAKLMTAIVALEKLPLDATVPVSARAAAQPAMKIGMKEGQVWTFDDALHSLLITSANDAAYAIAERASGSVEGFASDMTAAARRMGLRDSKLADPAGLDGAQGLGGGSLMSAYDLGVVGRNALDVGKIAGITKLVDYSFTGPDGMHHHLRSHIRTFLTRYAGATGLKAGYTTKATNTIVASATRNGRRMLAVVLGINGVYDVESTAERLLDQGFTTPPIAETNLARLPAPVAFTVASRRELVARVPYALGRLATSAPAAARHPAAISAAARHRASAGMLTWHNLLIVLVLLVVALVALRRRAVKRARRRRLARGHALAEARRRGAIDLVDDGQPRSDSPVQVVGARTRPEARLAGPDGRSRFLAGRQ